VRKVYLALFTLGLTSWLSISLGGEDWTLDQNAIIDANDGYIRAILSEDLDLLMTYYAEDVTLLPPMSPPIKGKNAVRAYWAEGMKQTTVIEAESTLDEILVFGNWAYSRGRYKGKSIPDDGGHEYDDKLNFSGMWHRNEDGSWRIARDMWNSGASDH